MKIFISQTIEKEIFKIFRSKKAQEIFVEKLKKINPVVFKKTDKAFGENIFWDKKLQDLISFRNEKISNDIEKGNFKLYS